MSATAVALPAREATSPATPAAAGDSLVLRIATFAALSAFAGLHWATLIADPPVGRVLLAVAVATGGASALAAIARAGPRTPLAWLLAALATLATLVVTLLVLGLPGWALEPANWDALRVELDNGLAGITGDVDFPYDGRNEWSRLAAMLGLGVALTVAAALAFWPARRPSRLRALALALLIGVYALGVVTDVRDGELLRGLGLCALVAAWLWLPSLGGRDLLAGAALVALATALALPLSARFDAEEPWLDYKSWTWIAGDESVAFNWNHQYGSIDWPREGTTLFEVISDKPHYWRAVVLDRFDGVGWQRAETTVEESLEVPTEVQNADGSPQAIDLDPGWVEQIGFRIDALRSTLLVGAGNIISVEGLEDTIRGPDGAVLTDDVPLTEGAAYAIEAYAPDPSERQLRSSPAEYAPSLARYTEVDVPLNRSFGVDPARPYPAVEVEVPLRGEGGADLREARRRLARSQYAQTYELARRLTASAPTAFDAVKAVELHLKREYTYSEAAPDRDYPLSAFLFEDRIGYCQQFSGAMALMLRMVGIPARVVGGFSPGTPVEGQENHYRVEDYEAHSWVEVWFNGIGWVPFDATPAAAPANLQASEPGRTSAAPGFGSFGGRLDAPPRQFTAPRDLRDPEPTSVRGGGPDLSFVPPLVGILGLVGVGALGWRALRYRRLSAEEAAEAQIRELASALPRLGWETRGGETLGDLRQRFQVFGKSGASRYVAKLRARRYEPRGRGVPTLAERRALRRDLARGGLRARLRALLAIPPGGPSR